MNQLLPFKLFANCVIIDGITRSLIVDLDRNNFHFIPSILSEILSKFNGRTIEDVKLFYKNDIYIDEYFNFLEEKEFIFFTSIPDNFPNIDMEWKLPCYISNAIIDIKSDSKVNWQNIIVEISSLLCKHIQIRFFDCMNLTYYYDLLNSFENSLIESIEIIMKESQNLNFDEIIALTEEFSRISSVFIFNCEENKILCKGPNGFGNVVITNNELLNSKKCGMISPMYFPKNIEFFTEAQHHNTCLNRKISIDAEGNIRNCPSMPQSFGNIKDTTLQQALDHPDFKKYWNHKKDDIEVCRVCEFRYICTDCRAYLEDPHNEYSKPLKCGYDPYTGEWSEWSTNPLKQAAIRYYGMEEILKG